MYNCRILFLKNSNNSFPPEFYRGRNGIQNWNQKQKSTHNSLKGVIDIQLTMLCRTEYDVLNYQIKFLRRRTNSSKDSGASFARIYRILIEYVILVTSMHENKTKLLPLVDFWFRILSELHCLVAPFMAAKEKRKAFLRIIY